MTKQLLAGLILAAGGLACSGGTPGLNTTRCETNDQCPAAHVCQAGSCERLCARDSECAAGFVCDGSICVEGMRSAPELFEARGSSSIQCDPLNTGATQPCIGTEIELTGRNLSTASFELQPDGGGAPLALALGSVVQDDVVRVVPGTGVTLDGSAAGQYTLVATNAAGTAQLSVQLLQGEPGSQGDQGVQGPPGEQGPQGPPGADGTGMGGAASSIWIYNNIADPVAEPTAIEATKGDDRMVVLVGAPIGDGDVNNGSETRVDCDTGAGCVKIDMARLNELCGDDDGCTVTVGLTGWAFGAFRSGSNFSGGPCHLDYFQSSGDWAMSRNCDGSNQYLSGRVGRDGSDGDDGPWPLLAYQNACYFAETAPGTGNAASQTAIPPLAGADDANQFYFFVATPDWTKYDNGGTFELANPYASGNWNSTEAGRACILTVQD